VRQCEREHLFTAGDPTQVALGRGCSCALAVRFSPYPRAEIACAVEPDRGRDGASALVEPFYLNLELDGSGSLGPPGASCAFRGLTAGRFRVAGLLAPDLFSWARPARDGSQLGGP